MKACVGRIWMILLTTQASSAKGSFDLEIPASLSLSSPCEARPADRSCGDDDRTVIKSVNDEIDGLRHEHADKHGKLEGLDELAEHAGS